jgi:hypothetical protein
MRVLWIGGVEPLSPTLQCPAAALQVVTKLARTFSLPACLLCLPAAPPACLSCCALGGSTTHGRSLRWAAAAPLVPVCPARLPGLPAYRQLCAASWLHSNISLAAAHLPALLCSALLPAAVGGAPAGTG